MSVAIPEVEMPSATEFDQIVDAAFNWPAPDGNEDLADRTFDDDLERFCALARRSKQLALAVQLVPNLEREMNLLFVGFRMGCVFSSRTEKAAK